MDLSVYNALLDRNCNVEDVICKTGVPDLDLLPSNPVLTVPRASELLGITAPPARKAIDLLEMAVAGPDARAPYHKKAA